MGGKADRGVPHRRNSPCGGVGGRIPGAFVVDQVCVRQRTPRLGAVYFLGHLGQMTGSLCASISSSIEWGEY